ncbi:hypothetical protein DRQ17_07585 [bacterium]|nr:MAG: hypothetical protein DRQ17_07585 [bacterium]
MKTMLRIIPERMMKFALVGLSGVFVNMGLLWTLTELLGFWYIISSIISIETSIITNFFLNNYWTFSDIRVNRTLFKKGLMFNCVSLTALIINVSILYILTEFIGIWYILSNMGGICAAFLVNYFLNLRWTWA